MARSMTAYGRGSKKLSLGSWVVEIHSVNRKALDIHQNMPKDFLRFDTDVRKWVADELARGQVTVRAQFTPNEASLLPPIETLKQVKAQWDAMALQLGFDPTKAISLPFLLDKVPENDTFESPSSDETLKAGLKEAVMAALKELIQMKEREGLHLVEDMQMRLTFIEKATEKAKKRAPEMMESFKKKLMERISPLLPPTEESQEKLFRELSFFAEKGDVTEELTRLSSHIAQFRHYLSSKEKSIGRTLDFLTQEINREINTLASKALETDLSHLTVEMKSECEKIREQLQNIE